MLFLLLGLPQTERIQDFFSSLNVCFVAHVVPSHCRLYPDKMFTHRKYFCGEGAQRTEAQAKTQRKGGSSCE